MRTAAPVASDLDLLGNYLRTVRPESIQGGALPCTKSASYPLFAGQAEVGSPHYLKFRAVSVSG